MARESKSRREFLTAAGAAVAGAAVVVAVGGGEAHGRGQASHPARPPIASGGEFSLSQFNAAQFSM